MPASVLTEGIIYEDTITSTKRVPLSDNAGISYRFTNVSGANVVVKLQDSNNADVVDFGELAEGDTVTYKVSDLHFASLLLYPRGECSVKVETLVSFDRLGERENDLEFVQNPTISTFDLSAGSFVFEIPYVVGTILRFINDGAGEFDVYLMKSRTTSVIERAATVITHLCAGKSVDYDVISSVKFSHVFVYVRIASTLKVEQRVSNVTLAENDKRIDKALSKKTDARVIGLDTFSVDVEEGFFLNIGAIGSTFDYSASHTRENGWECLYTNEIYWNTEITLKGYGDNSVNVYAWLDADNKILEVGTQAVFKGTLKAPAGAKKFVYNNRKYASLGFIYKGVFNAEKDPFTIAHFNGSPFENFFAVANGVLNSQFRTDKILLSDPTTEKACHVSSFVKVGTKYYYAYYCNYITATENVSQQTARFGHCNLDGSEKNVVDVMSVGDTYNNENVVALSDIVVLKKNNDNEELVLCWTIATGADWASRKWRLVYATYNILTDTLSTVIDCGISYNGSAISAFTYENISSLGIGSCPNGTIQIMPKITGRLENGVYTYYTGLGVETYCAVIKSTNLHDWEIVTRPIGMNCEYEPSCYILNDSPNILHWFCRQSASEGSAVYAQYDIANNVWKNKLYFQDTQSRPDMFEFDGGLYVIHAVPNRNHIVIEKIDVSHPWESEIHSDIYSEQSFYPFALVENDHIEISFTQDRKYIYLSNFSMYAISRESLNTKLFELLS
jgi:hypothetical protein